MVNIKELISSFKEEEYKQNLINLHIHTNHSDGLGDFEDIVNQAQEKGYRYIAISDHNTMNGYSQTGIQRDFLIPAVEFDVWYGYVFCHLLAYGIDHNHPALKPFLATREIECKRSAIRLFSRRNMKKLINAIHEAGGIAVLAHPACYWALSLDRLFGSLKKIGLDGAECFYPYGRLRGIIKFHTKDAVIRCAEKHGLIKTGGTDLHKTKLAPVRAKKTVNL